MTKLTLEAFTAQSLDEGFDEIIVREWDAHLKLEMHTHPFDVSAHVVRGEMWLEGVHVAVYRFSHGVGSHEPMRSRKLLLHREQIRKLQERMAKERLTLVPLSMLLKNGRVKVELALAKGRQKEDRRQAIAEKESKLEMRREAGRQRKGTA